MLSNILAKMMRLETVSPTQLNEMITDDRVTVLDVNSLHSWINAHVPGATNLDPAGYDESELPAKKESSLVFYCSNPMCRKAPSAAQRAKKMGYTNVKVMPAGINGWINAGLPTEDGE
jgi:rhodanese-related sulfurtransferase